MDKLEEESYSYQHDGDIFDKMKAGEPIRLDDREYPKVQEFVSRAIQLSAIRNTSTHIDQNRQLLGEIIGAQLDERTTVFPLPSLLYPFQTN